MSATVFLQLEEVLQSKGKMSKWEEELLNPIKAEVAADFLKAMVVSSSAAWPVFFGYPTAARLSVSFCAGLVGGRRYARRSINAGLDKFLGLEGTRIQTELASLILREYKDDESLLVLVRKHFYSEPVFGDVNPDVPLLRWRPRNTYADCSSPPNYTQADRDDKYKMTLENNEGTRSNPSENNGQPVQHNTTENQNWDLFVDPLECVFGYTEDGNEIKPMRQSVRTEVLSKRQARALKKAHRRQRSNDAGLSREQRIQ